MSESEFNDYNEIIYERDKLKEQNEKLKKALSDLYYYAPEQHDLVDTISKGYHDALVNANETLKSCES